MVVEGEEVPEDVLKAEELAKDHAAPHVNFYDPSVYKVIEIRRRQTVLHTGLRYLCRRQHNRKGSDPSSWYPFSWLDPVMVKDVGLFRSTM